MEERGAQGAGEHLGSLSSFACEYHVSNLGL